MTVEYADFGPAIASIDVDRATISTLKLWLPTYLTHLEQSRGLDYQLARPKGRSFANAVNVDQQWPDHELPVVLVAAANTQREPEVMGDGGYVAEWLVAVSVIVRGQDASRSRELASLYELAVRLIMVEQHSLGGFALGTRWAGGGEARPLNDPTEKGRYLGEGASRFIVTTDATVNWKAGPREPADSYEPLATVTSVTLDVAGQQADANDAPDPVGALRTRRAGQITTEKETR